MPTPNADAILEEIDRLAEALPGAAQRRLLAGLRAQVVQLVREARARWAEDAPKPVPRS